ncbi:hypothetical protein NQ317_000901 [Molorchus minor]|uniref:LRRK2 ARM repeat domain-containing protein n=1 Tax=Molorchus minor TaxID=1323400 RepID=A0ABQ9JJZ7_9CUCU|nr:hypothetical protein NQ317_000901 [Molorchus minor]
MEIILNDLMLTLCMLLVRAEFCKQLVDAKGLETIKHIMTTYPSSEKINRQCFKLLKALAGNDHCKALIIQNEFAPVILSVLQANKKNVTVAVAGLHCVSALCLRSPENSNALINTGIPEIIVVLMRMHPNENSIQKTASWAIRNLVSRNKSEINVFLELGTEELLLAALKKFQDISYDIKAALRDLNCNVQLKEEWTGKGGALTTGYLKDNN